MIKQYSPKQLKIPTSTVTENKQTDIFINQEFNQKLKDYSLVYVRKLLKKFTDKRGKDYQDIKKFVSSTFVDLGFLTEKQVVELFKTRRKKKPA